MICTSCQSEHPSVRVTCPCGELWSCTCPERGFTALAGTPQGAQELLSKMPLKTPIKFNQTPKSAKKQQKKG